MRFDSELVVEKLLEWEQDLLRFRLPAWEEIPDFGLYMDQLIALLAGYLDYAPREGGAETAVTAAAINNYVLMRIMPEPRRKRYYREHIAYLIVICTLKQSLNIAYVQRILPTGIPEAEVEAIYRRFVERHSRATTYFIEQVRLAAEPVLKRKEEQNVSDVIASAALISRFCKHLAERLILLEGAAAQEDPGAPD